MLKRRQTWEVLGPLGSFCDELNKKCSATEADIVVEEWKQKFAGHSDPPAALPRACFRMRDFRRLVSVI